MAMQNSGIFSAISHELSSIFSGSNMRRVIFFIMLIVVALGSVWAYRSYSIHREKSAHHAYAHIMEEFAKATESKDPRWEEIAAACKKGYEENSSSSVALYLLAFQAEALQNAGKKQEALDALTVMLGRMSNSNPLLPLYQVKSALIKMDMADAAVKAQGLQELETLATNKSNKNRDEALHYVAGYYWSVNEKEKAKTAWLDLVEGFKKDGRIASPYAQLAKERLQQIS